MLDLIPMSKEEDSVRVYVDAKIKGMHSKSLVKTAYVGYFIEGSGEHCERPTDAEETDDAEIQAILFAIERLRAQFGRITVVCDHESVVSEARRKSVKNPSPLLVQLREALDKNRSIELEAMQFNPAHKTLTEYVNQTAKISGF